MLRLVTASAWFAATVGAVLYREPIDDGGRLFYAVARDQAGREVGWIIVGRSVDPVFVLDQEEARGAP